MFCIFKNKYGHIKRSMRSSKQLTKPGETPSHQIDFSLALSGRMDFFTTQNMNMFFLQTLVDFAVLQRYD